MSEIESLALLVADLYRQLRDAQGRVRELEIQRQQHEQSPREQAER